MLVILHSCGLASSIVAKEGGDLSFIESQGQSIHSQLVSMAVDLHQILDVNTWINMVWLLLNTHSCRYNKNKNSISVITYNKVNKNINKGRCHLSALQMDKRIVPSALPFFDRGVEMFLFSFSPHQYDLVNGKYQALGIPY